MGTASCLQLPGRSHSAVDTHHPPAEMADSSGNDFHVGGKKGPAPVGDDEGATTEGAPRKRLATGPPQYSRPRFGGCGGYLPTRSPHAQNGGSGRAPVRGMKRPAPVGDTRAAHDAQDPREQVPGAR